MDFAGRPMSCKVVPLFGENDCFVVLPANCIDTLITEFKIRGPGVVVIEIEHNGVYSYSSWSQKQVQERNIGECGNGIGVPAALMKELGLVADDLVNVKYFMKVPQAKDVHVVPATVDDSEIIEHNQTRLEDLILRQLRVVYEGQIVPISVRKGLYIRIRVTKITKPATHQTKLPVVTLGDGTELIVETKTRQKKATTDDVKPPSAAGLRITDLERNTNGEPPMVKVSREMAEIHGWVDGSTLPGVTHAGVAAAVSASDDKTKPPSAAALRRHVFDLKILFSEGRVNPHEAVTNLPVPLGSVLLVDPSLPSSGTHQEHLIPAPEPVHVRSVEKVQTEPWKELNRVLGFLNPDTPVWQLFRDRQATVGGLGSSVLVTGGEGSGKTTVLQAVKESARVYTVLHQAAVEVEDEKGSEVNGKLKSLEKSFLEAAVNAPSVLLIDDVDKIVGTPPEQGRDLNLEMLSAALLDLILKHDVNPPAVEVTHPPSSKLCFQGVTVVATASSVDKVNPKIAPVFSNVVKISLPSGPEREEVARVALKEGGYKPGKGVLSKLSRETNNYTPRDVASLANKAMHHTKVTEPTGVKEITWEAFKSALNEFTPASLTGITMYKPENLSWSDVGGLQEVKKTFDETIILPTKYPELYSSLPIKMRSGILLYGPTGCGKSHVVSCAVAEAGLNCIHVSGPELLNKYIGQSEQRVREVFEQAQSAAPCILFFDEFDSIAPQRGHDNTGVTDRVVNQLLCHLDGAEGRSGVYVVAATARPDLIDKALLRPGRLDVQVCCDMPGAEEREEVLGAAGRKLNLGQDVSFKILAEKTPGFTSADLSALLSTARLQCIQQIVDTSAALAKMNIDTIPSNPSSSPSSSPWTSLNAQPSNHDDLDTYITDLNLTTANSSAPPTATQIPVITQAILLEALAATRPSISDKDAARNKMIYDKYKESRGGSKGGEPERPKGQRTTMA
eukprot:TRINITY_DN22965_c0_g1_i1.p1 TRINITY_DN22965_c0_g1~~TRINITY_DN22965_c0_g1_i1.p1  ORF type:complete len:975 (+),score=142.29 TRINITY_DN22965_c0_g1_i1:51-2927(+)